MIQIHHKNGDLLHQVDDAETMKDALRTIINNTPPGEKPNLAGAVISDSDLSGMDLSMVNLRDTSFLSSNLFKTNFDSSDLCGSFFHKSDLRGASFSLAVLIKSRIIGCNAKGARFSCADLSEATLFETDFSWAILFGATLHNPVLKSSPKGYFNSIDIFLEIARRLQTFFSDEDRNVIGQMAWLRPGWDEAFKCYHAELFSIFQTLGNAGYDEYMNQWLEKQADRAAATKELANA